MRDVAPSTQLRRWYGHDPARWEAFRARYERELAAPERAEAIATLRELAVQRGVVLLTATRDTSRSGARVIADLIG